MVCTLIEVKVTQWWLKIPNMKSVLAAPIQKTLCSLPLDSTWRISHLFLHRSFCVSPSGHLFVPVACHTAIARSSVCGDFFPACLHLASHLTLLPQLMWPPLFRGLLRPSNLKWPARHADHPYPVAFSIWHLFFFLTYSLIHLMLLNYELRRNRDLLHFIAENRTLHTSAVRLRAVQLAGECSAFSTI